jgi:formiminotetrahydrofolate cyclodeaminase
VASLLLEAAADGAAANVLVNLPLIGSNEWTDATGARVQQLLQDARTVAQAVRTVVESGEARAPLEAAPAWPAP